MSSLGSSDLPTYKTLTQLLLSRKLPLLISTWHVWNNVKHFSNSRNPLSLTWASSPFFIINPRELHKNDFTRSCHFILEKHSSFSESLFIWTIQVEWKRNEETCRKGINLTMAYFSIPFVLFLGCFIGFSVCSSLQTRQSVGYPSAKVRYDFLKWAILIILNLSDWNQHCEGQISMT